MSPIVAFFKLEPWEREYYDRQNVFTTLGAAPVFVDSILDDDHLPPPAAVEAEMISVFVDSQVTAKVLSVLPNLKFIATRSTGFDHLDLAACRARGIQVSTVPGYGEITVAEYTFALLLNLSRRIYDGYDRIRETGIFSPTGLKGFDLFGKTLGLIGTGRIGKRVAKIAAGFGLTVIAFDVQPDAAAAQAGGFTYVPLENLLMAADIVSIHVPYTPENHHLINAERLALMKPTAYLINTARGPLVDTPALALALKEKKLAGAGLDVLEEEGVIKDEFGYLAGAAPTADLRAVLAGHALFDLPNVVVTPHNAFNTQEALERILATTANNLKTYLAGNPENVVK